MKYLIPAILLFATGPSVAAENEQQTEASYINHLCSIAVQQPDASADFYLQKIKELSMRGESPSALNKDAFDQEIAEEVVNSWQSLSPEQRQQVKSTDGCQQILVSEFQQSD